MNARPLARFQTAGTSITLPNLLIDDPTRPTPQSYYFQLSAQNDSNPNLADAPNRGLLPDATYDVESFDVGPIGSATGTALMADGVEMIHAGGSRAHVLVLRTR